MEKYNMFMDWKNQYSENEYTTGEISFFFFLMAKQSYY